MVLHPSLPSSLVLCESIQLFTLQYPRSSGQLKAACLGAHGVSHPGDFREYATEHSTSSELPQLVPGTWCTWLESCGRFITLYFSVLTSWKHRGRAPFCRYFNGRMPLRVRVSICRRKNFFPWPEGRNALVWKPGSVSSHEVIVAWSSVVFAKVWHKIQHQRLLSVHAIILD